MNAQHFQEYLYTVLLSTQSNKTEVCNFLEVSITSLEKWLHFGLPKARRFLIVDKLDQKKDGS